MSKVTVVAGTADSCTVNNAERVPESPSVMRTSLMDRVGRATVSSLRIVPVPCASATLAPVTLLTLRKKLSFDSTVVSPLTSTVKVLLLLPAGMTWLLRLMAVKSVGDPAVLPEVNTLKLTSCGATALSETVNTAAVVPLLPSVTLTSPTDRLGRAPASSLRIVPTAWLSAITALVALDRLTTKVSSGSNVVSPLMVTLKDLLVWPAAMTWPVRLLAT